MSVKVNIHLYSEEEKNDIWSKHIEKIHPYNLEDSSKEELLNYIYNLECDIYQCEKTINYYKKYFKNPEKNKNRAHTYKVEMERYRRKLTRIYNLFTEYEFIALKHYSLDDPTLHFYLKCIEDMRKEIKNV